MHIGAGMWLYALSQWQKGLIKKKHTVNVYHLLHVQPYDHGAKLVWCFLYANWFLLLLHTQNGTTTLHRTNMMMIAIARHRTHT